MKQWLNDFKIAIIEENIDEIERLLDEDIKSNDMDTLIQAKALIDEAFELLKNKKDILAPKIQKLKNAKRFFE